MKAYITAGGILTVKSSTDLERYALGKWWEGWLKKSPYLPSKSLMTIFSRALRI